MKIQSVKISKVDSVFSIEINGKQLEKVINYKISSSAHGTTELDLKLDISDATMEFALLAN